jgi:hypothetical protein
MNKYCSINLCTLTYCIGFNVFFIVKATKYLYWLFSKRSYIRHFDGKTRLGKIIDNCIFARSIVL